MNVVVKCNAVIPVVHLTIQPQFNVANVLASVISGSLNVRQMFDDIMKAIGLCNHICGPFQSYQNNVLRIIIFKQVSTKNSKECERLSS